MKYRILDVDKHGLLGWRRHSESVGTTYSSSTRQGAAEAYIKRTSAGDSDGVIRTVIIADDISGTGATLYRLRVRKTLDVELAGMGGFPIQVTTP